MNCPKCKSEMSSLEGDGFSALKCGGCHGIWFRDGSHELAKSIRGIAAIDEEETNSASAYNSVRDINCPECQKPMLKMVDRTQLHIELEACTYCNGVFFDAGEFKDYTEFTLLERAKQAVETLKYNMTS